MKPVVPCVGGVGVCYAAALKLSAIQNPGVLKKSGFLKRSAGISWFCIRRRHRRTLVIDGQQQ